MEPADEDFLRTFYQALVDRPLEPDSPWYVPIHEGVAAPEEDPIQRLVAAIKWSPLESAQLLSGFPGTGKSTELRRLRHLLQAQGYVVVLCDMRHYLNLSTPVDISDFLISAAGAVSDALSEDPALLGEDVAARGYWQRAVDFMTRTRVEINQLQDGVKNGSASSDLKVGLRQDPSFREILQEKMKGHLGGLANDVRAFMADCVKAIRRKHGGDASIVVLFDSIEQIRGSSINEDLVFKSVETLFMGHSDKLRFQGMHVIYTVPPWLKIRAPGVAKRFDATYMLPCVKVRDRKNETFENGLEILRRVVSKRGDWTRLFSSSADLDRVILRTGGYLRDLFRALQGMLMHADNRGSLPLDALAVETELLRLRDDYLPIAIADARWLYQVASTHEAQLPTHERIPGLSRYFDNHLLLCYRNGSEWYDLHPLIRDTVEDMVRRAGDEPGPNHG